MRLRRPLVSWNGPHITAAGQDRFGAVRRHPRQHVEPHVAQARVDRGGPVRVGYIAFRPQVQAQHVLGDRQRHARTAQFAGVHVAVHPGARPHPVGFGTERQQPQFATLGRLADRRRAADLGKRVRPRAHLPRELIVGEEAVAKAERKCFETGDCWRGHGDSFPGFARKACGGCGLQRAIHAAEIRGAIKRGAAGASFYDLRRNVPRRHIHMRVARTGGSDAKYALTSSMSFCVRPAAMPAMTGFLRAPDL